MTTRTRAAMAALCLLLTTAEAAPERPIPPALLKDLRDATKAASDGNCEAALGPARKVRRSREFVMLPEPLRMVTVQVAALCAAQLDKWNEAYPDLIAATAFAESDDSTWRLRLAYELDGKRFPQAVTTVEAMSNGRGAALAEIPVRWFYQLDRQLKDAGETALRRRLLVVLTQSGYEPAEAGVGTDSFRFSYARLLESAGEHEAALAQVRQIEAPTLIIDLSLDPSFRTAFPADLLIQPYVEKRLKVLEEAAAVHPDQIGPVNDIAAMLRLIGRPKDALARLETLRARIEGDAEFSDRSDQGVWWWDQVARAHRAMGDHVAEIATLEKASTIVEGGGVNVSQTINLAEAQLDAGRPSDALRTLARLDTAGKSVSPYGAMQIVADRGCARARLGSPRDAAGDLAIARAKSADAPEALTRLLLCLGDMDGAARAMIARLENTDQRVEALRDLSDFAPPLKPSTDPMKLRLRELKVRPDVAAAVANAGGTRRFDVQSLDT